MEKSFGGSVVVDADIVFERRWRNWTEVLDTFVEKFMQELLMHYLSELIE